MKGGGGKVLLRNEVVYIVYVVWSYRMFNDAISSSHYTTTVEWYADNELEMMWKLINRPCSEFSFQT